MNLKEAVRLTAKMAGRRNADPYNSFVALTPMGHDRVMVAAHGQLGDLIEIDVEGPELNAPVAVPASRLAALLSYMPDAKLHADGYVLTLETEHAHVTLAGVVFDRLNVTPPKQEGETVDVPFDRDDFAWCARYAPADDSRPVLQGVAVHRETGAMAATDGFRLRITGGPDDPQEDMLASRAIVQAACLPYIPDVKYFRATRTYALFESADVRYFAQLIMGTYPPFHKLTPQALKWRVDIDTLFLRPAIRGPLSLIARDGSGILRITGDGGTQFDSRRLELRTRAEEMGECHFALPADIEGNPQVAMNVGYFRDVLAGCPQAERLTIQGIDPSSQLLFTTDDENRREVIMPMFVQWD